MVPVIERERGGGVGGEGGREIEGHRLVSLRIERQVIIAPKEEIITKTGNFLPQKDHLYCIHEGEPDSCKFHILNWSDLKI